nr:titin homolog [Danaus plexippus plexippus]
MATELYREAIHVPFMSRFVVYAKRTDECQAQLRMFCVTDDKEDKALERIERFIQVAKSRDVEVHEGKPVYLEFGGNLVPVAKSGEQLSIPFRAFRENRVAFPVMIKTQDLEPICRCQFMRDPKVPKGEPSPTPIAILNIMVPDDLPVERISPVPLDMMPRRTEEQELIWRQRLRDPRLEDICNLLGKDWVALAYELGVSVATVNQIQAKRITAAEQAQLMLKLWKTQSGTKAHDNSIELALCRIGRDDIIAPQSELINERRIQRNIYQERQASEEIEAYKAEEDNKLKESTYDDSEIAEHSRTEDLDQDEAKYSPEEKSILDKSEMDRTPTPSEESEEDEDVKRSVAERKEQITKKLSSSKIPASKQKKELREEIIEIKTQIKPDIKKFQDIEQQVKAEPRKEHIKQKQIVHADTERETEIHREQVIKEKTEEVKTERTDQFRKYDPSSPAKPTPKHLQRHMRNESMRFPSGDFSNVTITPRKSITVETETKQSTEIKIETFTKETISQKEIDNARVEEKLDDGESSPGLVFGSQKDIAEATLKDKINAYETKILREPTIDTTKPVKLTKEALRRHTQEQDQGIEYTQAFVREQSKQIENQKIIVDTEANIDTAKSVKETIQHFDSKTKYEDKTKIFPKTMRTDSTLVQVSSEEDSEFLKKSTDSETETESQTTIKIEKDKKSKFEQSKQIFVKTDFHDTIVSKTTLKKDDKKQPDKKQKDDDSISIMEPKIEEQLQEALKFKVSQEELTEVTEEKDVILEEKIKEKAESQPSITSTKSDLSKQAKTDSLVSETQETTGQKLSQESTLPSTIDKTDSLADLQQSTEKDVSFVSQTESKMYSKESKHRSDSLDETSQFSDLDDQMGMSPAHKPLSEKPIIEEVYQVEDATLRIAKDETIKFLNFETEYSKQGHSSAAANKEDEKISPVISAKARQFIETVPEDDSVQECFFSKRIYSDSLEESDHTDSRRHSEADSLKSDQSDIKAKISSSDFDERAEYEETVDSGSAFGDEKFEESIGFTTLKIDPKILESTHQDSGDSGSPQTEESDIVFKKMTPKRHSRTESVSITKLSDLSELIPSTKQEFHVIVTEAEETDRLSDKDEVSDKISSESSREIEISDRKSSEGISDRISSEDAVTDKKTSSEEEHVAKEEKLEKSLIDDTIGIDKIVKETEKVEIAKGKGEPLGKDDIAKRQSVTSVGSGSVSELRLDEKRLSDAHSITESRDYTFEESEDDIGTQGTHVDIHRERVESSQDRDTKAKSPAKTETSKIAKLSHGDSLDDVEGFPEDHVMDYVPKLPHIAEVSSIPDKKITSQFLMREREEQLKRELLVQAKKEDGIDTTVETQSEEKELPTYKSDVSQISDYNRLEKAHEDPDPGKCASSTDTEMKKISVRSEEMMISDVGTLDDKVSSTTENKIGDSGEKINITTMIEIKEGTSGDKIIKTTITETTTYPSGEEHVSVKVSERVESLAEQLFPSEKSAEIEKETKYAKMIQEEQNIIQDAVVTTDNKTISSQTETVIGETGEKISTTTVVEQTITPSGEEITKTTVTETTIYPTGEEKTTTKVSESSRFLEKRIIKDDKIIETEHKPLTEKSEEDVITKTLTESLKTSDVKNLLEQPSCEDIVLTTTSESDKLETDKHYPYVEPESTLEDRLHMMLLKSDESEYEENKTSSTDIQTETGPNGEEIKRTVITETIKCHSGEERVRTTITEVTKNASGEETISTKVSESVKCTQHTEQFEEPKISKSDEEGDEKTELSTTESETEIGPNGEEIKRTILTEKKKYPSGEERIKTTITEKTKYPSGEETVSVRVSESVKSIQHTEKLITALPEQEVQTKLDELEDKTAKSSTTETSTEVGPNGEEIKRTIVTEVTQCPSGDESVKTTTTEVTKYPSGEETVSTRVSESIKSIQQQTIISHETDKSVVDKIKHKSVVFQSDMSEEKFGESDIKPEQKQEVSIPVLKSSITVGAAEDKDETFIVPDPSTLIEESTESKITTPKFDISKIRTDTLSQFDLDIDSKKTIPKDLKLEDTKELTKDHVTSVIDDILQKGTIVAAAKSPIHEKDVKIISKEILETERRLYDTRVPQKEERRHSCISPAISLERIAESEIEMEEEVSKIEIDTISSPATSQKKESQTEMKKSDSAMKQMADNIEIIIKQASEDLDASSEEAVFEEGKPQDLQGEVSVDSIIEEALHTVEDYLVQSKVVEDAHMEKKKDSTEISEDTKVSKERPAFMKSLSRDSGEVAIMPKKKQSRTFSVQSSPDEVEEQIYTDSESDMDKAKVLEIIEPTSDIDGKLPTSSFDIKKIKTDSLDDADDFPEKEVEYFEDEGKFPGDSECIKLKDTQFQVHSGPSSTAQPGLDDDRFSDTYVKKTHFVDSVLRSEIVSKSTTESSLTTVISTLTKSSDDDQKSVLEDGTSADLSKISGADLVKDPSKTSMDAKEESRIEDQTDDISKKSIDLTKDYSKSSIDSKDTSRDFATNELSKDSTVDLTKDFSKVSIDSVKETSRSLDEKTFSEEHSSFDVSKTLASDASDIITKGKELIEEEISILKAISSTASFTQEQSVSNESKLYSEHPKLSEATEPKIETDAVTDTVSKSESVLIENEEEKGHSKVPEKDEESEVPDIKELNRRCSNLLDDISAQGALIRIDSSHVSHDLSTKFSKTPPPSPVDLIMKEKVKREETVSMDKITGLQPKGSDSSFLDANRQSPRASSAGDSLTSETEAHQSEILTEASKALSAAATPKSPTKHIAENITFVNVDKPTITVGAQELVDRTIEKSIDVIDQIKKEMHEDKQVSSTSDTFYSQSKIETSTSSSSIQKTIEGSQLKFQSIDPEAVMSDMIAKFGATSEYSTVLSHKETETRKISGQEYFSETKQVSSSDDDSLIIKTETSHELRGQEHEMKEKTTVRRDGDQTETSQKKMEKAHEATAKRSDIETKTVCKSTDDTDIVKIEREFCEQGLYTGRQTKSEERMTALKDETIKKKQEVKISERDLSHEQWGKEYFTEPAELEDIKDDCKARVAFVDSNLKIVEKDETLCSVEVSEKGQVISSKVEHHKEESVIESKEHDDLSSDASHVPSFKSETVERQDSSEGSPKSKSRSFKKDDEVYEVDFIKEIKISTSPVKSAFSRTGSQDTHSESEVLPELPHDDKTSETPKKDKPFKSPVKLPQNEMENVILEVSIQKESANISDKITSSKPCEITTIATSSTLTMSSDTVIDIKDILDAKTECSLKTFKIDTSPSTQEITDDLSTISKDAMIKSGESIDTEYMVKSLESHEGEGLQKSMDSTVSAETLHPSEFSNEADSAFITGSDQKKEGLKLLKEKSTEDICSSGYDTDFSSAEFHGMKLETERVALDSLMSAQPLADLSVLEKTIDEVKQSLEAAQGEIISEKSDGSIKYKQSPSEFQFKILLSPDRPEAIKEEPTIAESNVGKNAVTDETKQSIIDIETESISQNMYSQEETSISDEEKATVQLKESSPPLEAEISMRSDSGPHSILETESDYVLSDRNDSSKGSPEVKLRVQKHIKSQLGVAERRSTSEIEGWSSSGESHYHSFEHSESRPLSSDVEVMMTAQSGTDYDTALTSQDISSQSLRTSKDYFTAGSSLASRDSMRSLDSDASSHVASIDISDASETLVPSANELKEELMESSTYVEQFLHAQEKGETMKTKESSDDEISGDEEYKSDAIGPVGKMKRSHEMRFQPKDMIPEHFPHDGTSESIEFDDDSLKDKEGSDTTISSQLKTDEPLSSSISKVEISSSQIDSDQEEIKESITKASVHHQEALPFSVTKVETTQRQFVDVESEIIPIGSAEYEQIQTHGKIITPIKTSNDEVIVRTEIKMDESTPQRQIIESETEIKEEFVKKEFQEIGAVPFPITEKPPRQREFVDIESDIIPEGTKQYEEILKSKSDSSVPKTKVEKSGIISEAYLESKQSSTSSLKTHEHLSTPQTPLSAPSQSSLSTDNGREYVLDDMYDISETPELKSDLHTVSSKSELVVTTEERTLQTYEKEQESPTSDEFEMVDKPSEMDDFVVIEEVAKEAQETDPEGKSLQIKSQVYVKRHDTEVEEYLSKTSKKQESTSSASGSLSDEELQLYELEQKRIQAQELAEIEAGKRWIQMQFEGDPRYDYERIPLEDIKEEEMTDFDNSRIGSLSSQKESIGSFGSFRNSYGSLSESEMASRMRFRLKGENDDISISSLQEFENLERALMEQYNQHSSSQDSLNGSLPRRYILSRSQGDDISVSSLKEFEGLETACLEALKAELIAKQKEALLLADPKVVSGSFLEQEKRSYDSSSESSPPLKSSGSPGQKSGSPSQKGGSPSQKVGSYGSPSQRLLADSAAIRKLIDQQLALEQRMQESRPKVVVVKKTDEKGSFFVPEPLPGTSADKVCEVEEECKKVSTFTCAAAPSDGSAESIPGDCEEMMKILDQEEKSKAQINQEETQQLEGGVIEIVRTTTVIQQKFVDGKKVSETIKSLDTEWTS